MKLPAKSENSQKGQILIVFLLVLVVGLAIALSIASRSVTDVRQTTTSDESNRAYFAAEAGVENALKKIEDGTITASTIGSGADTSAGLDLNVTNRSSAEVTVKNLSVPSGVVFEYPSRLNKDDVAQINLMPDFYDLATAGDPLSTGKGIRSTDSIDIYWDETGSAANSAIEVSIVTCDASPCTSASTFSIRKMVFDAFAATHGNNFCSGAVTLGGAQPTNLGNTPNFKHRVQIQLNSTVSPLNGFNCTGNDTVGAGQRPVLARIRLLYASSILLAVGNASGRLPNQGYQVESLGKVGSGVARKLLVNRLYPALPSVFDYVLYNGSTTNPLSK